MYDICNPNSPIRRIYNIRPLTLLSFIIRISYNNYEFRSLFKSIKYINTRTFNKRAVPYESHRDLY